MPLVKLPDVDIYYEITGDGLPLMLIHGLGSSSRDWEKQIEPFARSYQVITFDLRGHGRSSKPSGPYSVRMFAEDTAELIRALGIAPLHVIGISMGGMVAFELAVNYPEFLQSLTIVNSYPEMRVETLREHIMLWRRYLLLELLGMRGTGVMLGRHLFPYPEQSELRKLFVQHWAENDKRAYRNSLHALANWDVEAHIGEINCPTLIVASDQDYLPLEEKRAYAEKIPNAKLVVIENARHAVTAERPEQFNMEVRKFLDLCHDKKSYQNQ